MERDDGNHPLHPTAAYGQRVPSAQLAAYMARHRMGGFLWDFSSDRMSLEPGALAVFDFEPGEFDGRVASLHDRMVAGDLPVLQPRAEDMSGAGEYGGYFRVVARDGTRRWAHVQGSIQRGGNGDPLGAVGFIRDATLELSQVADETVLASARQEQAEIVRSISASLSRVVTVQDLLSFLTRPSFLEVVGASDTTLSVLDNDREKLLATRGLPNDLLGLPPDLFQDLNMDSAMPVPEAIRLQRPLFITREDVRVRYPQLWPYVEPSDLTSAAILPLAAEGRPTGGMSIMYEGRKGFTPEERNLLVALASTVSQCLQRALLYDREHSVSIALQEAMLPARIPHVPGVGLVVRYHPSSAGRQVGGDWYDVIPFPDGTVNLVIGDVQGHDVHAAAVMGQLRTALRAYVAEGHAPSDVMGRASTFLSDLQTELLATCTSICLNPATGICRIVRAGHPNPLLRTADHRSLPVEAAGGLPLGLPQDIHTPYPTTKISLDVGDTLLLCTDGLLESPGFDLDAGQQRISAYLESSADDLDELADRIITDVVTSQGTHDDIALLLAKRTG